MLFDLFRVGKDFAWKHVKEYTGTKERPRNYLDCKYCDFTSKGGINRLKHHLAGSHKGVHPCPKAPPDVVEECQKALTDFKDLKEKKTELVCSIGRAGNSQDRGDSNSEPSPILRGPMDQFVTSEVRQATLNSKQKKEQRKQVCRAVGRFIYGNALSFNVANSPYFYEMCRQISNFGPGFKPPTAYELRTWILKEEVAHVEDFVKEHKKSWAKYGCTIMSDGWSDQKSRSLINFLVNSPAGTVFYKSIDASASIKNAEFLAKCIDEVIEEVGEENVVQIISDNAANYKAAGEILMEKRKSLYWTPCAAHCLDLMLESIGKMKIHEETLLKAREVTKFIYGHCWVLSLMREYTKNHEILRPAVTRFATAFLTLQSIYKQKGALREMFSSQKWNNSTWAKKPAGMKAQTTICYDSTFWPQVAYCVKTTLPLVEVLREVDSETKPAMGFIYEMMDSAKEKIAFTCGNVKKKYIPIWKKIDERWNDQLHRPLHAAGYYLNPHLRYEEKFSNVREVKDGLYACMDRMIPDRRDRINADVQLDFFDEAKGDFGTQMAIETRKLRSPGNMHS